MNGFKMILKAGEFYKYYSHKVGRINLAIKNIGEHIINLKLVRSPESVIGVINKNGEVILKPGEIVKVITSSEVFFVMNSDIAPTKIQVAEL